MPYSIRMHLALLLVAVHAGPPGLDSPTTPNNVGTESSARTDHPDKYGTCDGTKIYINGRKGEEKKNNLVQDVLQGAIVLGTMQYFLIDGQMMTWSEGYKECGDRAPGGELAVVKTADVQGVIDNLMAKKIRNLPTYKPTCDAGVLDNITRSAWIGCTSLSPSYIEEKKADQSNFA